MDPAAQRLQAANEISDTKVVLLGQPAARWTEHYHGTAVIGGFERLVGRRGQPGDVEVTPRVKSPTS